MPEVHELLLEAAKTFESRNKEYGNAYLRFGKVMAEIFPAGLTIDTPTEWMRLGLFIQIINKACRASASMPLRPHPDSIHDLGVYAFMLESLDK